MLAVCMKSLAISSHYCTLILVYVPVQLKNAPDFTKVKVNAPIYKGSGGIEPSEERSQKQDKAAHGYAEVDFQTLTYFGARHNPGFGSKLI